MERKKISICNYKNIPEAIIFSAKTNPYKIAMKIPSENDFYEITYLQLVEKIKKVANYLKLKGFKKGEKSAVLGENRPEWGICYLGIILLGGIVVPLDSRATSFEWANILSHSESRFIFVSGKFYEQITEIKEKIKTIQEIISFDIYNPEPNLPYIFSKINPIENSENIEKDDMAILLYTSGTTSFPKGVILTHKNILSNIDMILKVLNFSDDEIFFSVLPLHHVFEGTCGFLLPLILTSTIFYASSLKTKELIEELKIARPTVFLTVPLFLEKFIYEIKKNLKKSSSMKRAFFYFLKGLSKIFWFIGIKNVASILFRKNLRAKIGLDNLKYLISGGASLPEWISKEYELMGFPIFQGYGLSETSPVISVNIPRKCKNKSVGIPLPGIEVKIFNPDTDGIGEIIVKGPNVMKGYYKNEKETKEVLKEGWFFTGDMGKIDKDGFLYITGRKKSVIVTKGGKNIYPEEIENEILKSPFIKEALVLAKIHPKTKIEKIHAIIYPDFEFINEWAKEEKIEVTEEKINEIIRKEIEKINLFLSDYKRIRSFSIRNEEFPKTTTQKIKRYLFELGGIEIPE